MKNAKFEHTTKTAATFNAIIGDYRKLTGDTELEKRGLSYSDYKYLGFPLDCLRFDGEINIAQIGSKSVVNWLVSLGARIENDIVKL